MEIQDFIKETVDEIEGGVFRAKANGLNDWRSDEIKFDLTLAVFKDNAGDERIEVIRPAEPNSIPIDASRFQHVSFTLKNMNKVRKE